MKHQTLPIKFSYQVQDNFFAGEYPFEKTLCDGKQKLDQMVQFGISQFIDLTEKKSGFRDYSKYLPQGVFRLHVPCEDMQVPLFKRLVWIHNKIEQTLEYGEKLYLHCKGGYDRTGIAVATWFIYNGDTPEQAWDKYMKVFLPYEKRKVYKNRPCLLETEWHQLLMYKFYLQTYLPEIKDEQS